MYCMIATCLCTARQYHTRPPRRYHALWSPLWPHVESHHKDSFKLQLEAGEDLARTGYIIHQYQLVMSLN